MPAYFRYDGWVKSAVGPAVPGAQIYVCDQPANTVSPPPTPLATIFSDPNGLVPIVQPIITDGFGHYDFYVLPGTYTQVVALGGVIQQVYPDQSIGIAGSVTTPLVLKTNGVNNTLQALFNLVDTASVTWLSNPDGSVRATVMSGSSLTLQTNGVNNTSQATLNLKSGSSITLASDGIGGVTISSTGGLVVDTPGNGYFIGPGLIAPVGSTTVATASFVPSGANGVYATQFILQDTFTIRKVTVNVTNPAFGGLCSVGIYSADRTTKLLDSGTFDGGTTGVHTNTISAVTLTPGTYWLAQTGTSSSISTLASASLSNDQRDLMNAVYVKAGLAANAATVGVLPGSLGIVSSANFGTVYAIFEP